MNLDSILKSRDITLPTKVHLVKAMVFPMVMYGRVKTECRRIDACELWCWRRLLRIPWTAKRSNQSILKEITLNIHWKDWCWSWSSILWPPDAKNWLIGEDPDAGEDWRWEDVGGQREALCPWQRSWGRRLDICKGGIEPQESPWNSSSIYPHNQSMPTLLLCALTYTSDFMGGCPPPPLSEKELT